MAKRGILINKGVPKVKITIYTDDMKYQISSTLGDYNSDILSVNTQKSLSAPSGTFQITFVPKLDSSSRTWFTKLDAFDYVEIEFQGTNDPKSAIVMRGLIDSVQKQESWEGGQPQRSIVVNGRDLGSLLENHQIYYIPELGIKESAESILKVLAWKKFFPVDCNAYEAFDFIGDRFRECVDINFNGVPVKDKLGFAASTTFPDDRTNLFHLCSYEGPFWNAFQQYLDKPFHEIFVYDAPDMAWLVMRPARLKDAIGDYHSSVGNVGTYEYSIPETEADPLMIEAVQTAAAKKQLVSQYPVIMYPRGFSFTPADKIAISVSKTHQEVFNYYLTIPTLMLLSKEEFRGLCLDPNRESPGDSENPFFQIDKNFPAYLGKYGFRKMEASTVFINLDVGQRKSRGKDYESKTLTPNFLQKGIERNRMLVAWFLHNEYLQSGSIDIRGTNAAVIGTYAHDTDDDMEYYIESVSHSFVLFHSFKTTLNVTRGQPISELGGLVGLGEAGDDRFKYEILNKYYFYGSGTKNVSRQVQLTQAKITEETQQPKISKETLVHQSLNYKDQQSTSCHQWKKYTPPTSVSAEKAIASEYISGKEIPFQTS